MFHAKTRGLEKAVVNAFPGAELLYSTAPIALSASDLPDHEREESSPLSSAPVESWGWWRARHPRGEYVGLEQGLQCIADVLHRHGPIDGVIGFSQGAAAAAMVVALLEPGRRQAFDAAQADNSNCLSFPQAFANIDHSSLRFVVCYSGIVSKHPPYAAFYAPPIVTPSLHFIGSHDTIVEEDWAQELVASCEPATSSVVLHPGGHFVPTGKRELGMLVSFIRQVHSRKQSQAAGLVVRTRDEDVLDMDVPF